MANNLVLANFTTGYETYNQSFLLDNVAFPVSENALFFRGQINKKQGTFTLGRFQRSFEDQSLGNLNGVGDIDVNLVSLFSLETNSSIVSGSLSFTDGINVWTEPATPDGTLVGSPAGTGTINYATGDVGLRNGFANAAITGDFSYYPNEPGLGIRDFNLEVNANSSLNFPTTLYFDTHYNYLYNQTTTLFNDNSFYAFSNNPLKWFTPDYRQYYALSLQDVIFVTNNLPNSNFLTPSATATTSTTITFNFGVTSLIVGDQIWFNEFSGATGLNGIVGVVTTDLTAGSYVITFASAVTVGNVSGIALPLTWQSSADSNNGLKYYGTLQNYDGSTTSTGWANFSPPLSAYDASSNATPSYLLGARLLVSFGGRMLAIGTYEGRPNSTPNYYPNRIRYSKNGFIFYNPIRPITGNATNTSSAWYNGGGNGGFLDLQTDEAIISATKSGESLTLALSSSTRKITTTGNPIVPFIPKTVDVEKGSESTFGTISIYDGYLTPSDYGYTFSTSNAVERIDVKVPDAIYQIRQNENGQERVTAIRDFSNELVFFSFPLFSSNGLFNNYTFVYNYREKNFTFYKEQFTAYGYFRENTTYNWNTLPYDSWFEWDDQGGWIDKSLGAHYPQPVGANQQGYVQLRDVGSDNGLSHYISDISGTTTINVTSPNHCMEIGDFIEIENCIFATQQEQLVVNNLLFRVQGVTNRNIFQITSAANTTPLTSYLGLGEYRIIDNINLITKSFTFSWQEGRGLRIGPCRYLLQQTSSGEVSIGFLTNFNTNQVQTLQSYAPYLIGTDIVRTRPDETLGLYTTQNLQDFLWHRKSTSLTSTSVQLRFYLSDEQMLNEDISKESLSIQAAIISLNGKGRII